MIDSFPAKYLYGRKLANTCFISPGVSGISVLNEPKKNDLSGDLWLVADAGWQIDLTLNPDGTISGTSKHWYATLGADSSTTLAGSHKSVSRISECFNEIRANGTRLSSGAASD